MKVRMLIEVEVSDEQLVTQFGEQLPKVLAGHAIEMGLARAVEEFFARVPTVKRAKAAFIPDLLS